jgi:hypothetical protein
LSEAPGPIDLSGQLEALSNRMGESNPELYRHLALYLQVLRQVLPHRVQQACFHLATQIHPQRYAELPDERRRQLHGQIEQLVIRCSSLLTVEQLTILAAQIHRERQRREQHDQQQILEELSWGEDSAEGETTPADDDALPPGSVRLGFAPPLSGNLLTWSALQAGPLSCEQKNAEDDDEPAADEAIARTTDPGLPAPPGGTENELSVWQRGQLPRDPMQVLLWMDGMEMALARRLRNLSHAINVELLRAGLNRSLLPVSLLDAVLSGQLETMAAPANLLRLPLPFGAGPGSPQAQTMAVLLRPVEVELEEPRLRTCRRRLQQHRQEVRRMAQQFRRLQRRLQTHQAEKLWLLDLRPPPTESD